MFPSTATMAIGVTITAVLALIDWYVWRIVPTRRDPRILYETLRADDRDGAVFKEVA